MAGTTSPGMLQLAPDEGLGAVGRSAALLRPAARPLTPPVNLRDMWRGSVHDIWRSRRCAPQGTGRCCRRRNGGGLARPDDEGFTCGVDDVLSDARQLVDLDEAVDLGEQALDEAEVPARDAGHGGQGLGVVEFAGR